MDEGFLDDGNTSIGRTRWIPGPIEVGPMGGTKKYGRPRLEVSAFRCRACGRLELVAHQFGQLAVPSEPPGL
jgi:hypothetical protein